MPKVSKDTVEHAVDHGPVQDRYTDVEGYTVSFVTFAQDVDGTPMVKGLPEDRCQCPHWGYVLSGRVTFRFPDGDEILEAGDAFYAPPGHVPLADGGSEIVMFSPTEQLRATDAVMAQNMRAMAG